MFSFHFFDRSFWFKVVTATALKWHSFGYNRIQHWISRDRCLKVTKFSWFFVGREACKNVWTVFSQVDQGHQTICLENGSTTKALLKEPIGPDSTGFQFAIHLFFKLGTINTPQTLWAANLQRPNCWPRQANVGPFRRILRLECVSAGSRRLTHDARFPMHLRVRHNHEEKSSETSKYYLRDFFQKYFTYETLQKFI